MCGRFTLTTPTETIGSLFPKLSLGKAVPRYNVAPTQMVACVRNDGRGEPEAVDLRWGLIPFWSKDLKMGARMINARSETVAEKPAYRAAFQKRRCLVLADGYLEWKKTEDGKQPYHITMAGNDRAFAMAGLWERWKDKSTGDSIESCTVITTDASPDLYEIHDRMPAILDQQHFGFWLDSEFDDPKQLQSFLQPQPDGNMVARPVSRRVNNARNDDAACLASV